MRLTQAAAVSMLAWLAIAAPGLSCGSGPSAPSGPCAGFDAIAAASDYSSSTVGGCALDGGTSFHAPTADLGRDPALATSRGRAFYIARELGTVFEIDPRCGRHLATLSANDPGKGGTSNPYDVAVAPDGALWIVRYDVPSILVLAPDGSRARTIDLSSYDPDGNPQASAIRIVDGAGGPPASTAFVVLERLDDNNMLLPNAGKPPMVLPIDVATAQPGTPVVLAGGNPFGLTDEVSGAFYLADAGNRFMADDPTAGIEKFDVATGTSRLVVRAHDLGGWPAEVAVAGSCGIAIVAGAGSVNPTSLVAFDPGTGAVQPGPILATSGYFLQALAWVGGSVLLVGEGDPKQPRASVVHVFDRTGSCSLMERPAPIPFPLKPIALRAAP